MFGRNSPAPMEKPFQIALRQASDWVSALRIMTSTTKLLRSIYQPSPLELGAALRFMQTSWSLSLFYTSFVQQRQLLSAKDNHERYLLKALLRRSAMTRNHTVTRSVLSKYSELGALEPVHEVGHLNAMGHWEAAISTAQMFPKVLESQSGYNHVLGAAIFGRQWELALTLRGAYAQSHKYTGPSRKLNSLLCKLGRWDLALNLFAESLASGVSDIQMFMPLVISLSRLGFWKEALSYAIGHGALDHLKNQERFAAADGEENRHQKSAEISTPNGRVSPTVTALVRCLSYVDLYPNVKAAQALPLILQSPMRHTNLTRSHIPMKLLHPGTIFFEQGPIAKRVDADFFLTVGFRRVFCGSMGKFNKVTPDDAVIVLDTNFFIWSLSKGLPFSTFREEIRALYPHLRNAPLETIICPFRALLECNQVIFRQGRLNPARCTRVMKMLRNFLFVNRITATSFSTEVACNAFFLIQKLWGLEDLFNPDRHILNLALGFQFETFCKEKQLQRQSAPHSRKLLDEFLIHHANRAAGNCRGHVDPHFLLCTFDKSLSMHADSMGVLTYPCFSGTMSNSKDKAQL